MRAQKAVAWLGALGALGAGCEIIAGLQDRQLEPGDATVDATPDVGPACNPPHTVCFAGDASQCIDTTGDINHCGGCNKVCNAPDAGAFDATSGNPDPGIPSLDAGADVAYVSVPSPSCEAGTCRLDCSGSEALCSGLCYDTENVHDHCGDCTTACPASQWCHTGHCCDAGSEYCDGGCAAVQGDKNNCGGCGITCGAGTPTCNAGTCVPPVVYTDTFINGSPPTTQCTDWTNFKSQLTGTYTSITIHGTFDTVGHTCTGPSANLLCQALHNGTVAGPVVCNGFSWLVSPCITGLELNAASGICGTCNANDYELRPCIGNVNWGGVNTAVCSGPTQSITVACQ